MRYNTACVLTFMAKVLPMNYPEFIIRKILTMAFTDPSAGVKINKDEMFERYKNENPIHIVSSSTISSTDSDGNPKQINKNEKIIIYKMDDYAMFETLLTYTSNDNPNEHIVPPSYSLVLVTPYERTLDCDFFDTSKITGNDIENDDKYEQQTIDEAGKRFSNKKDIEALSSYIKYIRETTFDKISKK